MGASVYRSSYSGKGSTSTEKVETKSKSTLAEIIDLLKEVEDCKERVTLAEKKVGEAKKKLQEAEETVNTKLKQLDPTTRDSIRRLLKGLEEPEGGKGSTKPEDGSEGR